MKKCIDLKQTYGHEYRIGHDPAYFAEYGANGRTRDPWYWRILCKHGHIYPHGGETLAASTVGRGAIANRLAAIPGVQVAQDGSDGINVIFPFQLFGAVAEILQPKKRRQLTPAHREALVSTGTIALARYRKCHSDFGAGSGDLKPTLDFQAAC